MQNKKRGPATLPGKKVSSKNAIKHGATARGFINEQERDRFEKLLSDLADHYDTNNPLIKLQLERIARVTIQLERIQNTIDALFEKSRAQSNLESNLMEYMKISPEQRIMTLIKKAGVIEPPNDAEEAIRKAVITLKLSPPANQQGFLDRAPNLSAELYQTARSNNQTIEDYIDEKTRLKDSSSTVSQGFRVIYVDYEDLKEEKEEKEAKILSLEDTILETSISNLMKAIHWKFAEIQLREAELRKLNDFERLMPIEEQATLPNLDQLDRLMRYQTTLQRQLSTTIGEVMALAKKNF